jgi:hypothetical protein
MVNKSACVGKKELWQGDFIRMDCDEKNAYIKTGKGMSGNIKLCILKLGFNGGRFREVYEERVEEKAFV